MCLRLLPVSAVARLEVGAVQGAWRGEMLRLGGVTSRQSFLCPGDIVLRALRRLGTARRLGKGLWFLRLLRYSLDVLRILG